MLKDLLQGKPFRQALHPFLVHFPIGFFALSLFLDLATLVFSNVPGLVRGAFYLLVLGIITALIAAVPGFVDYLDIPRDRKLRRTATVHMILNLLAVGTFAVGAGWRSSTLDASETPAGPLVVSIVGMVILGISGYLGGHMVFNDGAAVGRHRKNSPGPREALRFFTADATKLQWEQSAGMMLVPVKRLDELQERELVRVKIDQLELVLTRIDGVAHVFQEYCTHRYGPMSEGQFCGNDIVCPWHRSCFDVRTGKVTQGPAKVDLRTFRTEIRNEMVCIGVPIPNAKSE